MHSSLPLFVRRAATRAGILLVSACASSAPGAAADGALAPAAPLRPAPGEETAVAAALLGDGSDEAAAPADGAALLAECAARMPCERVFLAGTLNMRKRYGVSLLECAFEVAADYRTPDMPTDYLLLDERTRAPLLSARTARDPARGLVVERTDGGPAPASTAETILGTDLTWLDVGIDFVNWRNPALAGEDRLKGRVCDLLDVEPVAPIRGCAKARLWIDRAQKVVMQASQFGEDGREVRKLWVRAVQKVDGRWIFKDLEVETIGSGHRTRLHFDLVSFPDSALQTP